MIEKLFVLVEEPSMEVVLESLLPKILRQGVAFKILQFQCKSELLKQLPNRFRGYASWLPLTAQILVVVDRDQDDCVQLKEQIEGYARAAGLGTRRFPARDGVKVLCRIAIEELEAWFFGDWNAVRSAYPKMSVHTPLKAAYRDPDAITGGTWESLEKELRRRGYFASGLRKLELSRKVAENMHPLVNRSKSFCAFRDAVYDI